MPSPLRRRVPRDDRGSSLTETLVSLGLLAVVGGGATTGIVAGIRAQNDNQTRTTAANLVRADLDAARAVPFPDSPAPFAARRTPVGDTVFLLRRTVTEPGSATPASCPQTITSTGVLRLLVTSTATWDNGRQQVSMSTVIAC